MHPEPLQLARAYDYFGKPYRVGLLNACRARLDPLFREARTIHDRLTGRTVRIETKPQSLNVSPSTRLQPITD